jgi:hypothetical protein
MEDFLQLSVEPDLDNTVPMIQTKPLVLTGYPADSNRRVTKQSIVTVASCIESEPSSMTISRNLCQSYIDMAYNKSVREYSGAMEQKDSISHLPITRDEMISTFPSLYTSTHEEENIGISKTGVLEIKGPSTATTAPTQPAARRQRIG